jgi:hypothetical protein
MAPGARIVVRRERGRLGDRQAAAADAQVDRRVDLGVAELHQNVVAGNAELRGAERDEGRDVERAHAHERDVRQIGRELERARAFVGEGGLGHDADVRQDR